MQAAAIVRPSETRRIAVITGNAAAHAEIQRFLGGAFELHPLNAWGGVAALVGERAVGCVLADLDTLGMPPAQALEVLAKARSLDQDLVLIAFTRVTDRELRL